MRIEITFKDDEKVLLDFLTEKSKYISRSGYIKQLLASAMEKENEQKKTTHVE